MKTIIVPLDGSALAAQVLPYVRLVASVLKARVRLIQVLVPVERAVVTPGADEAEGEPRWEVSEALDALSARAEHALQEHADRLREAGLEVDVEVQFGHPAEVIVETAIERHATMIAMATHGYSGLRRLALGSVADEVVHTTHVPVLLVRGSPAPESSAQQPAVEPQALKRILVPLDGSDLARQALGPALDLAIGSGAEVMALRAISAPLEQHVGAAEPLAGLQADLRNQVALAYALRAGSVAPEWSPVTPVVVAARADEAIAAEAERQQVDLIVMATRGYSGFRRWVAGSVADRVLHATMVPLLLVHGAINES